MAPVNPSDDFMRGIAILLVLIGLLLGIERCETLPRDCEFHVGQTFMWEDYTCPEQ